MVSTTIARTESLQDSMGICDAPWRTESCRVGCQRTHRSGSDSGCFLLYIHQNIAFLHRSKDTFAAPRQCPLAFRAYIWLLGVAQYFIKQNSLNPSWQVWACSHIWSQAWWLGRSLLRPADRGAHHTVEYRVYAPLRETLAFTHKEHPQLYISPNTELPLSYGYTSIFI